jgi:DHA2 family multidrug resistance protein
MPLSQTLLMKIFPPKQQPMAIALWSTTTLVAPTMGPVLGGVLCDTVGWPAIFYINVPIAVVCAYFGWQVLKSQESPTAKARIDIVGLGLMILWVAALQIMLDEGKNADWFNSPEIVILAIVAAVGFAAFLIWELTEKNPIVPLRVFRHRGYTASVLTLCVAFAGLFASMVLTPLWLQGNMGYTASWSGYAAAANGVLAVIAAPFVAQAAAKVDARKLVFIGVLWLGAVAFVRGQATTEMTFMDVMLPMLAMGVGMPLFFVPLSGLALSSVDPEEMAGAAGLMNFARTLTGAFAVSVMTTAWDNGATHNRAELVGLLKPENAPPLSLGALDHLVQSQAVMLATNQTFLAVTALFLASALVLWLAPKPAPGAAMGGGGH